MYVYTGGAKSLPDSLVPRRLASPMIAMAPRHSGMT